MKFKNFFSSLYKVMTEEIDYCKEAMKTGVFVPLKFHSWIFYKRKAELTPNQQAYKKLLCQERLKASSDEYKKRKVEIDKKYYRDHKEELLQRTSLLQILKRKDINKGTSRGRPRKYNLDA